MTRSRAGPLLVGLLALVGAAAVAIRGGIPRPSYHDELSYLLAADTFAHGRLTNPPHRYWQHFETFHVLQQPTYASKYPPAQGVLLAVGQVLWHPILGVWLGVFLMASAVTWMLRAFVPPRWALFGGLLVVAQVGVFSYWAQSYWGGALGAAGGAVVFGALGRILRGRPARVRVLLGVALASGLVVLANTRPFEGSVVSLAAAAPLLLWLCRPEQRATRWLRVALPIALVLVAGGAAMMRYNQAVTGDPLRLPYSVHNDAYMVAPHFIWQPLRPVPEFRHEVLHRFFADFEVREIQAQRSFGGWASMHWGRLRKALGLLFGPVLLLPLLALPWCLRARGVKLAIAGAALMLVAVAVTTHLYPHYLAPSFGLFVLLAVQGWRRSILWLARRRFRVEVGILLVLVAALAARLFTPDPILRVGRARASGPKAAIAAFLERQGGRHVVFVRYGPLADLHDEWVANGADIDAGRIVWARAMPPHGDDELIAYYADRRAWRVDLGMDRRDAIDFVEVKRPPVPAPETAISGAPTSGAAGASTSNTRHPSS